MCDRARGRYVRRGVVGVVRREVYYMRYIYKRGVAWEGTLSPPSAAVTLLSPPTSLRWLSL